MAKKVDSKEKAKENAKRKILTIVFVVLSAFCVVGIISELYNMIELKKQADVVNEELEKLKDENSELEATKTKLEDPNYVQSYARGEYMFSNEDEKVFYLPSNTNKD